MTVLQDELGLTYIFVSHDLSVVQHLCDRVAVMFVGRIVEEAATDDLYSAPRHPYTETLLRAVPLLDAAIAEATHPAARGGPRPGAPPRGCTFHPRCPYAGDRCEQEEPELREPAAGHGARCHFADELTAQGGVSERVPEA